MQKKDIYQWIHQITSQGYTLYMGSKKVNPPPLPKNPSKDKPLTLTIAKNYATEETHNPDDIIRIEGPERLLKYGFVIKSIKAARPGSIDIRDWHDIEPYREGTKYLKEWPHGKHVKIKTYAEYDTKTRSARLIGPLAYPNGQSTPWTSLTRRKIKIQLKPEEYDDAWQYLLDTGKITRGEPLTRLSSKIIKDRVPIMITIFNQIVCLPITQDSWKIGIGGLAGQGKTFIIHVITDITHHYTSIRPILGNDNQNKNWAWMHASKSHIKAPGVDDQPEVNIYPYTQWSKFQAIPRGVKGVLLYPSYEEKGSQPIKVIDEGKRGFYFSLPYKEIIRDFTDYYSLKAKDGGPGSEPAYSKIKPRLFECTTVEEYQSLKEKIYEETKDKNSPQKIQGQSLNKIFNILDNLIEKKITDLNSPHPSTWTIKKGSFSLTTHPAVILSYLGVVPFIVTSDIDKKSEQPLFFRHMLQNFNELQRNHPDFEKNHPLIIMDEVASMLYISGPKGKIPSQALPLVEKIAKEGRNTRVSICLVTQNFSDLSPDYRKIVNYFITFNNPNEGKEIVDVFKVDKNKVKEIAQLKRFEAMLFTPTEQIVLIEPDGTETLTRGPVTGTVLFPLSMHAGPNDNPPK